MHSNYLNITLVSKSENKPQEMDSEVLQPDGVIFVSPAKHSDTQGSLCQASVCPSVRVSHSHTFLVVKHSYVLQATHAFLGSPAKHSVTQGSLCPASVCLSVQQSHFFGSHTQLYFSGDICISRNAATMFIYFEPTLGTFR